MQDALLDKQRPATAAVRLRFALRSGLARVVFTSLLLAVCTQGTTFDATAAEKRSKWNAQTHTEPGADPAVPGAAPHSSNPTCTPIMKNIERHIAEMRALTKDIETAAKVPPATVYALVEGLLGNAPASAHVRDQKQKLELERKTVDELNAVLRASQCPSVDVGQALQQRPSTTTAAPVLQKTMPDLLPLPQ